MKVAVHSPKCLNFIVRIGYCEPDDMCKIHVYVPCCSEPELGVLPNVEREVSLLVVPVLPAVVSVDVITWVVSAGPSTGHVDM